jgi:hypothetical protein
MMSTGEDSVATRLTIFRKAVVFDSFRGAGCGRHRRHRRENQYRTRRPGGELLEDR